MKPDSNARFQAAPAIPEQVANYLQDRIVRGTLAPGERIAEARITEALNVSRGSVREALRLLDARHLVDFEPRRGARVTAFGPRDVNGLYDLQIALLTLLVGKVALAWNDADLAAFLAIKERIAAAAQADQPLQLTDLSYEFQRIAADMVGNPFLAETLARLTPAFSRAHYRALAKGPAERLELAQFIEEVLQAALQRDVAMATDVVKRYGEHQRQVVLATFTADAAAPVDSAL